MKRLFGLLIVILPLLAACSSQQNYGDAPGFVNGKPVHPTVKIGSPYTIKGETYRPHYDPTYSETGEASWYGPGFHGGKTANGEAFNQNGLTAAHRTLPLPSMIRVTNLNNGKSIVVRVNDRGPFADDRILDVSKAAAQELDMIRTGVAKVKIEYLKRETEAYIAQLGGQKSATQLAWEQKNLNTEPRSDVARNQSASWLDSIIPSAHAGNGPEYASNTNKAAELDSISSSDLPPPINNNQPYQTAQNQTLPPEKLPQKTPASSVGIVNQQAPSENVVSERVAVSYTHSPYDVLESNKKESVSLGSVAPQTTITSNAKNATIKQAHAPPSPSNSSPIKAENSAIPSGNLYIQVGAFSSKENALRIQSQYSKLGNTLIQGVPENAPSIYRVRLGPFEDRYKAEILLSKVREQGAPDAQLLMH